MQRQDDLSKNEKTLWDVQVQEEYSSEFLEGAVSVVDSLKEKMSQQPSADAARTPVVNTISHSGKWEICRGEDIVRVAYSSKVLDEMGNSKTTRGIAYFGKGIGIYLPVVDASQEALGTTNIAYVVRYTSHAAYYLAPVLIGGRDFQPPDLVMLCGMNPLMMFWADSTGWIVVKEDDRYMVIEKRGPIPCLPPEYPLRVRVWLDKLHGFSPYRVEKYNDDPSLLPNYRSVAREIWQVSRYVRVNGVYRPGEFSYIYYIKGRLVNGKLVYDGRKRIDYRLKRVSKCEIGKIELPDYVSVADFSLSGKDPVLGTLDRAVTYRWREHRRLLNEDELKALFREQFPEPEARQSSAFWKAFAYVPPILMILLGFVWLVKRRK